MNLRTRAASCLVAVVSLLLVPIPCEAQTNLGCQLTSGDISVTIKDNADQGTDIHTSTLIDTAIQLGDIKEVKINHAEMSKFFKGDVRQPPGGGPIEVFLRPIQTALNDHCDVEDKWIFQSSSNDDGFQVVLNNDDYYNCFLYISVEDENSQAPQFQTDQITLEVPSTWNTALPINWNLKIPVTDRDRDPNFADMQLDIQPAGLRYSLVSEDNPKEWPHVKLVNFYFDGATPQNGIFTVVPSDGVNPGTPMELEVQVKVENVFDPVFTGLSYHTALDKMPSVGEPVQGLVIGASDPDDPTVPPEDMDYEVLNLQGFFEFEDNILVFSQSVPQFFGTTQQVRIKVTERTPEQKSAEGIVDIKFPDKDSPKFSQDVYTPDPYDWPDDGDEAMILDASVSDGLDIEYTLLSGHNNVVYVDGDTLRFKDVSETTDLGKYDKNRVAIVQVEAAVKGDPLRKSVATIVIAFPTDEDPPTTTTTTTTSTTTPSTTTGETTTFCPPCPTVRMCQCQVD